MKSPRERKMTGCHWFPLTSHWSRRTGTSLLVVLATWGTCICIYGQLGMTEISPCSSSSLLCNGIPSRSSHSPWPSGLCLCVCRSGSGRLSYFCPFLSWPFQLDTSIRSEKKLVFSFNSSIFPYNQIVHWHIQYHINYPSLCYLAYGKFENYTLSNFEFQLKKNFFTILWIIQ